MNDTHSAEIGQKPTLYALILAGLIEWAGEAGDMEDIRSVSRHLTPLIRAHIERERAALEARILAGPSCGSRDRDHDGCYVKDALLAVRTRPERTTES